MVRIIILLIFLLMSANCYAKHLQPETVYQKEWCNKYNGIMEYKLPDKTRVDCVTKNYAVEFDFANKWAEAVGQSIHYGMMTGKKPAIILIIEQPKDFVYYYRLKKICAKHNITLWYMKSPLYEDKLNLQYYRVMALSQFLSTLE